MATRTHRFGRDGPVPRVTFEQSPRPSSQRAGCSNDQPEAITSATADPIALA